MVIQIPIDKSLDVKKNIIEVLLDDDAVYIKTGTDVAEEINSFTISLDNQHHNDCNYKKVIVTATKGIHIRSQRLIGL